MKKGCPMGPELASLAAHDVRIRELEAELATERKAAEYERMRLGPDLRKMVDEQKARAEKAETRVLELEALLQRAVGFGLGGTWEHEAATWLEGHERKAD